MKKHIIIGLLSAVFLGFVTYIFAKPLTLEERIANMKALAKEAELANLAFLAKTTPKEGWTKDIINQETLACVDELKNNFDNQLDFILLYEMEKPKQEIADFRKAMKETFNIEYTCSCGINTFSRLTPYSEFAEKGLSDELQKDYFETNGGNCTVGQNYLESHKKEFFANQRIINSRLETLFTLENPSLRSYRKP